MSFLKEVVVPAGGVFLVAVALVVPSAGLLLHCTAEEIDTERERIRVECEARGGHVSDGMAGSHRFRICVEPDGSMPHVSVGGDTTVVPVVIPTVSR